MLVATASMLAFLSVVAARGPLTSNAAAQQTAVLRQRGSGVDAKKVGGIIFYTLLSLLTCISSVVKMMTAITKITQLGVTSRMPPLHTRIHFPSLHLSHITVM